MATWVVFGCCSEKGKTRSEKIPISPRRCCLLLQLRYSSARGVSLRLVGLCAVIPRFEAACRACNLYPATITAAVEACDALHAAVEACDALHDALRDVLHEVLYFSLYSAVRFITGALGG